ncbi:hypothetical protein, partial [Schaalia canis]|uniref:hypothetical protein n=1 Tax=Schaalia canis TaxID=100469 RepID=UPI0010583D65
MESALEDFRGVYSMLFADASRLESEDRVGLARALDDVAEQVRDVISAAEREEERQERVYQASVREQQCGKDSPFAWGVPFVDDVPISPPAIGVSFSPRIRSRLAGRHNGGGKVGARPEALRAFVEYARGANTALVGQVREVERAWVSFTGACAWANAGALTLLDGADGFIAENRLDEGWIETVAAAFDKAGAEGFITEVELSVAVAALDPAYARGLLLDETLTLQQLTLVVSRLCVDPGLASIVAEHTNGVLKGLTLDSDSDQVLRASALLKGLSTSGPASAALLTALKAEGLIDRIGLAGGYAYMGSG